MSCWASINVGKTIVDDIPAAALMDEVFAAAMNAPGLVDKVFRGSAMIEKAQ